MMSVKLEDNRLRLSSIRSSSVAGVSSNVTPSGAARVGSTRTVRRLTACV